MTCPFQPGAAYRVLRDFTALRDMFRTGEILIFKSSAYSRYDGMTGYFFSAPDDEKVRVWDLADDDDPDVWTDLFEPYRVGRDRIIS